MGTVWYIRTYRCDNGIEYKTKFPVRETESVIKSYSKMRTAVRRAEKGATEASHELGRLLNCNFRAKRDAYIGLDYSDEGLSRLIERAGSDDEDAIYAAADHEMVLCVRRAFRECAKRGIEVQYAFVTSDLDGDTGERVRVHHHLVCNAEAAEIFRDKWTLGGVYTRTLYGQYRGDLTELAEYMVGQVRYIRNRKRYTPSRNLKKAMAGKPIKARRPEAELAVPAGCEKIYRGEYHRGRPQNIRYYRPPETAGGFDDE